MELTDEIIAEISYVQSSKYRKRVMESLVDGVKIPSQIAKDSDIRQAHISNILKQLKEHELVECINPEVKKGRLYRHTDKGVKIVKNIR